MSIHAIALIAAIFLQTPGKLEIKDTTVGTGREAKAHDVITVEYTGTLADGKQFDSSKGKAPLIFELGTSGVIKGWDQGLLGMKVGGERMLTVPPDLAYGDTGAGSVIPPKATLKFDIKLLRIDRAGDKEDVEITKLKPGKGPAVQDGDIVDIHYLGTFLNGTKFDSSYDRKEPMHVTVGLTKLIKGFIQGFQGIKEGEKRRVVIPSTLAYGSTPRGPIPPNSTLVFEMEAVKVTPKAVALKKIEEDRKKLKIEDITAGTGPEAKNGDILTMHFTATFADGKKLGSSHDNNQPMTFQIGSGQSVRGLEIGLIGMKAGGRRKITIPPDLAYGAAGGGGGAIPPNSTLTFDIELIKIGK